MAEFDLVIIGSGPAAVGALATLDGSLRIGVVTGAVPERVARRDLQAKIQAVTTEDGHTPGVAEPLVAAGRGRRLLFSSAAVGGLANYWGQQVLRWLPGDPWPADVFGDYGTYANACETIEALFALDGGSRIGPAGGGALVAQVPRLLVGTSRQPALGLSSMEAAFRGLAETKGATMIAARATRIEPLPAGCEVHLHTGDVVRAGRVLLAAGVIGDARLLLRSFPDLKRARFRDHAPFTAYTMGLRKLFDGTEWTRRGHFNVLSLERLTDERSTLFASVYDMGRAELNLLLAATMGRTSRWVRGWPVPSSVSLVNPVQVWTPETTDTLEIDAQSHRVSLVKDDPSATARSRAVVRGILRDAGLHVLGMTRTEFGFGFHYHDLGFSSGRAPCVPARQLLAERTNGAVQCIDASVLRTVGCRPPTLTAMAMASRLAGG